MTIVELRIYSSRSVRRGESRFGQSSAFVRSVSYLRLFHFIAIIHLNKFQTVVAQLHNIRYSLSKRKLFFRY